MYNRSGEQLQPLIPPATQAKVRHSTEQILNSGIVRCERRKSFTRNSSWRLERMFGKFRFTACFHQVMKARAKVREHEKSIRIARGDS